MAKPIVLTILDGWGFRTETKGNAIALARKPVYDSLLRDFPKLRANVVLVVGGKDLSVPPDNAFEVEKLLPVAVVKYLRGLGHLAHEERPEEIEKIAVGLARSIGVLPAAGS